MATLADFLERALPWPAPGQPGVVNLHWRPWKGRGVTGGRAFTELQDLISFIAWAAQGKGAGIIRELYYCTSLQKESGPPKTIEGKPTAIRNYTNTLCSKAFFVDIDKGYETPGAALAAVQKMCEATSSPQPSAIVVSGNGLHVYWFSTVAFPPEEWRRYAVALDTLLTVHNVTHDAITTDITRILRPPGTFNNKGHETGLPPKPVVLKYLAPADTEFAQWKALTNIRPPETTGLGLVQVKARAPATPLEALYVNPDEANVPASRLITNSLKPEDWTGQTLDPAPVFQCPMFKRTLETGGDGIPQPLWNQQALACTFLTGGEQIFHDMSKGDSRYTYNDTEAMFARKVSERVKHDFGYPRCTTFERDGAKECASCPFKGLITSPLSLRWPKADKVPTPPPPAPPRAQGLNPHGLVLPDGCAWSTIRPGAIDYVTIINKLPVQRPLIMSVISNLVCTKNRSGEFELSFRTTTDLDNFDEVTIKNSALPSPGDIGKILASVGVSFVPSQLSRICDLMNSFLSKLKEQHKATSGIPYGWITTSPKGKTAELSGFAYGGKVYNTDGSVSPAATGDRVTSGTYLPRGDEQSWFTALDTLLQQGRIPLQTIALCGFAAPLMKLTGFHGVSVMAWGDSGGNKSSASDLACGIWGSPKLVKETPSTSQMSFQGKMAETRHLLNCWDDIQKSQYERIGKLIMEITHGKGGGKMTATHDQKDMGQWDSILLTTSNDSLADFVVQANKNDAAALFRCFEFRVDKVADNTPGRASAVAVEPIYTALDDNFGYIGLRYARLLGHKINDVREVLKESQADIETGLGGRIPDNERFWATAAACLVAASVIGNAVIMSARKELNLPNGLLFDTDGVKEHVLEVYRNMRFRVQDSAVVSSSEDYARQHLSSYLLDRAKNTVWTDTTPVENEEIVVNLLYPPAETMRYMNKVTVRWHVAEKQLDISRRDLTEYLTEREIGSGLVISGLKKYYKATQSKRRLAANVVGTTAVQEHLLSIPVTPGSWLYATLVEHSTPLDPVAADPQISDTA
jgi:hypothetical protein